MSLGSIAVRAQREMLQRINELHGPPAAALVRTMVPGHAVVAVVSRGDDGLVVLDGRSGWHHYEDFRRHLEDHHRLLVHRADTCAIFALDQQGGAR